MHSAACIVIRALAVRRIPSRMRPSHRAATVAADSRTRRCARYHGHIDGPDRALRRVEGAERLLQEVAGVAESGDEGRPPHRFDRYGERGSGSDRQQRSSWKAGASDRADARADSCPQSATEPTDMTVSFPLSSVSVCPLPSRHANWIAPSESSVTAPCQVR